MVDHELLTLAAKAAGLELTWPDGKDDHPRITDKDGAVWVWNPCEFPGDCLQLEVKLGLNIICTGDYVRVRDPISQDCPWFEHFEDYGGDKLKARMMASTRAAAEIGKAM